MSPRAKQRFLDDVLGPRSVTRGQTCHIPEQRSTELRIELTQKLLASVLNPCHIAEYGCALRKVQELAKALNRSLILSVFTVMKITAPSTRMLVVAASLGLTLSACGSNGAPAASSPAAGYHKGPTTSTAAKLTISGYMFSALTAKAGTSVTVSNADAVDHTVTIGDAGVDVNVPAGGTATFTAPSTAGEYKLTCDYHAAMTGTLTVVS
jgi:plastocyanin